MSATDQVSSMRPVLTVQQAASRLGCGRTKAHALFDAGELRGYRVGVRKFVFEESVPEYIARHANRCPEEPAAHQEAEPAKVRRTPGPRQVTTRLYADLVPVHY